MILAFLLSAALAAGAWFLHPWATPAPFLIWLFVMSFFRDFERRVPADPDAFVSPADGRVTEIVDCEEPTAIGGPAVKIGIFLSVFNCHVNRAPWGSVVDSVTYTPGLFLDARDPQSSFRNESNAIVFRDDARAGKMLVRQIAGLIARRIVCTAKPGDRLERGQRIGMIKFGSRTELYVPKDRVASVAVKVGDRVYGAKTVLGRLK
jgi:phosphatidylserine decarboxylase